MTDNTRAITLKLQKAKNNAKAIGYEPSHNKVFLGNFVYAEFDACGVTLTDEDGSGKVLDTIRLNREQLYKLEDSEAEYGRK